MQSGDVGLLGGSDSGASNNFTFPGWTFHRELELLVDSGLSSMEALQTATRNPARFFGELESNGTVEEGKTANVVLLNANPLEDIRYTQKIDSVVSKGKRLTRVDLDKLLDDVAANAASAAHLAVIGTLAAQNNPLVIGTGWGLDHVIVGVSNPEIVKDVFGTELGFTPFTGHKLSAAGLDQAIIELSPGYL